MSKIDWKETITFVAFLVFMAFCIKLIVALLCWL